MRFRGAVLRRRSLRFRIVATFVATAFVLAGGLSTATLLTVGRFLEDQRVRSSTRQTFFALLFARQFLASSSDLSELASKLQVRQNFDAMVTRDEEWFSTNLGLTPEIIPTELGSIVGQERVVYQISTHDGSRVLVYGSPLPPAGVDLYLLFPMEDIDRTVGLLARVLTVSGLVVVGIAAISARRVSTRILFPLSAVSGAAQRMAEGLLETRVETVSADELGQLAASFNQMAEAVRDLIKRERDFVAAVSHELRTPLAALNTASEVLAKYRDALPPPGREALDLLSEDVFALRQLVEDLMEISDLDAQRVVIRVEEVRLRTFVEALLARRHREASVDGPDALVTTDKTRLERIIGNLVDNAFTHGDGRDVAVRIFEADGSCGVTVSDRGPGVDPSELPLLFGRFYKPDRSRTRERGGVGLGLAIANENARALGGRLEVVSKPDEGTAFTLTLPREPHHESEAGQ